MPQMAPMMWLSLYIFFSAFLILFSILNFFSFFQINPSIKPLNFKKSVFNWMW